MPKNDVTVWIADSNELYVHFDIRHLVFVNEQGALVLTDIDEWDNHPRVAHLLASSGQSYAGTVRMYPLDDTGRWKGDRLAVLAQHRKSIVGTQLVRFATVYAAKQGGRVMEAIVQLNNVRFFERLGWYTEGDIYPYLGLPHQPMLYDLTKTPALDWGNHPSPMIFDYTVQSGSAILCPA